MFTRILKWIDTCSLAGAYLSAFSMLLIVLLILVEICLRSFFNASTFIADEYSGYLMVTVVMAGLGYTLQSEGHIRISLLLGRLGERGKRGLELFAALLALGICGFVLYHAVLMVYDTFSYDMRADSISETALYLPQLMVPVGLLGLALQVLAYILRRLPFCSPNP